jgi:hypothetical protein
LLTRCRIVIVGVVRGVRLMDDVDHPSRRTEV